MPHGILELTWSEAEGIYTLTLSWPAKTEDYDRLEVGRILHRCGFSSLGDDRWIAPDDMTAPLEMLEAFNRYGIATGMSVEVLPPILESRLSRLPLF